MTRPSIRRALLALFAALAASGGGTSGAEGARPRPAAVPAAVRTAEGAVDIRADRFQADAKTGRGVFEGGVVATRGDVALRCERLEVEYDAGRGDVARALASGGVRLRMGARTAAGAEASWDLGAGRVVLKGSPWVRDGATTLRGEEIRVDVAERRMECVRCRATWSPDGRSGTPPAPSP